jgi:folate-binding protein YgfZ
MTGLSTIALKSRTVIAVTGPDWRAFLQGLVTQDVESVAVGEARFAGLLTPQGRLLYDLFVIPRDDEAAWLDVATEHRDAIITRLMMYRLRAKVQIAAVDAPVAASITAPEELSDWVQDPRHADLGWRGYGVEGAQPEAVYDAHRLSLGIPAPADWGSDKTYPIEADFDLLAGIDFHKGCFVGQETTSRMHRRGTVKNRMAAITFDGPAPAFGTEILNGTLRAGEVLSGAHGRAMAMLRLDRLDGELTADGKVVHAEIPAWLPLA